MHVVGSGTPPSVTVNPLSGAPEAMSTTVPVRTELVTGFGVAVATGFGVADEPGAGVDTTGVSGEFDEDEPPPLHPARTAATRIAPTDTNFLVP